MSSQHHDATGYGSDTFSWDKYHKYRPVYPESVYKALFDYHKGKLDVAIDFGCGPGTMYRPLRQKFSKVIGVDFNQVQIEEARRMYPEAEFHVAKAESVPFIPDSSVDLVACGTGRMIAARYYLIYIAVHWFQPDDWLVECARILKPGGTLSFW